MIVLFLLFHCHIQAFSPEVESGLQWLVDNQNPTRSWGKNSSVLVRDTTTALDTLRLFGFDDSTTSIGIIWLKGTSHPQIDSLARKISTLAYYGEDTSSLTTDLLNARDSDTGAWGFTMGSRPDVIDTVLAIKALGVSSSESEDAVQFIKASANHDGGFGYTQPFAVILNTYSFNYSQVYPTALVISTLCDYSGPTNIASCLSNARGWLLSKQNVDGGFGFHMDQATQNIIYQSTVWETALSYLALLYSGSLPTDAYMQNAYQYIISQQLPDGSWDNTAFDTALALRVLINPPFPTPTPTSTATPTATPTCPHVEDTIEDIWWNRLQAFPYNDDVALSWRFIAELEGYQIKLWDPQQHTYSLLEDQNYEQGALFFHDNVLHDGNNYYYRVFAFDCDGSFPATPTETPTETPTPTPTMTETPTATETATPVIPGQQTLPLDNPHDTGDLNRDGLEDIVEIEDKQSSRGNDSPHIEIPDGFYRKPFVLKMLPVSTENQTEGQNND